ncbi:PadR family transcriptional regulator [Halobacteriales archaeon QS_4_69_225]|nr:MAG: PadR family transcriptional regulator [Halobacteriales archaeon QS_4_69_225]
MSDRRSRTDAMLRSLLEEMNGPGTEETEGTNPAARTEAVVEETATTLHDERTLSMIDEGLVKQALPELLTALVRLRTGESNGTGVMDDLKEYFGADLSPGTVYPVLHELADEGPLSVHELVRTKEYSVEDADAARGQLAAAMGNHLALGLVFRRALEEFDDAGTAAVEFDDTETA